MARSVSSVFWISASVVGGVEPHVSKAVIADLMALVLHAAHKVLIAADLFANEKKGRVRAAFFETVEQCSGRLRRGAVVKRQCDAAAHFRGG